ncbi:ATP-binding protein [soil metagenome]
MAHFCVLQICAMLLGMENPFEFGRELGSEELVNRTEEIETVRQTIESSGKLFVIGPRRFGKTSILKASAEKLQKEGNIILRYNAEAFAEIDELVKKIIEDSARLLKGSVEKTGELIKRYFKSLRPEISFSVTQSEWKSSIGVKSESSEQNIGLLVDALEGVEKMAAEQTGKRVALIIDEFQEILSSNGVTAEKQIRSAIQTHKNTAYIFAGSKTRLLTEMTTDASRPFYRLGTLLFIGELPRGEFSRFLLDKFTFGDFFPPKSDKKERLDLTLKILDVAEDVPYNVQMLAHSLWNRLSQIKLGSPENAFLSENLIDETLEKILRQTDPFYTQIWNGLTTIQKKALTAVVAENGQNLQSIEVTRKTKVSPSSMRRALESMSSQDILRHEEKIGTIRYRFEDPFFAHWINLFAA